MTGAYRVVAVAAGYIESHIDASANLETEAQVKVFSRATNLLAELFVEEGDKVAKVIFWLNWKMKVNVLIWPKPMQHIRKTRRI